MRTINLVFIGEEFYRKSNTMMSSIYTETGERFDWGFVNVSLSQGNNITIRQATEKEKQYYESLLNKKERTR